MRRERRKNFRVEWNVPATIYDSDRGISRPCVLVNISTGGACISGLRADTVPDEFILEVTSGLYRSHKCKVLWRGDNTLRVQFTNQDAEIPEPSEALDCEPTR